MMHDTSVLNSLSSFCCSCSYDSVVGHRSDVDVDVGVLVRDVPVMANLGRVRVIHGNDSVPDVSHSVVVRDAPAAVLVAGTSEGAGVAVMGWVTDRVPGGEVTEVAIVFRTENRGAVIEWRPVASRACGMKLADGVVMADSRAV